jgi:hypothetical protein
MKEDVILDDVLESVYERHTKYIPPHPRIGKLLPLLVENLRSQRNTGNWSPRRIHWCLS